MQGARCNGGCSAMGGHGARGGCVAKGGGAYSKGGGHGAIVGGHRLRVGCNVKGGAQCNWRLWCNGGTGALGAPPILEALIQWGGSCCNKGGDIAAVGALAQRGGPAAETPRPAAPCVAAGRSSSGEGAGDAHPQRPKEMGTTGGLCCGMGQGERHPRAPALLEGSWGGVKGIWPKSEQNQFKIIHLYRAFTFWVRISLSGVPAPDVSSPWGAQS